MPKIINPEIKAECLRLRMEERKSYKEISAITGISKGTLSGWLTNLPLTVEELKAKTTAPSHRKKERLPSSNLWDVVSSSNLSTSQIAKVSEAAVSVRLLARGFDVFGSSFDGDKADWLVVSPSGTIYKIQVKTTLSGKTGLPTVPLRSSNSKKRYKHGDFDFIVGFDIETDTAYLWSWGEVAHLAASVTITDSAREAWDKLT